MSCLRAPGQLPSHDITGWTVTSKFMRTMVLASLDPNMNMIQFCLFRFVYTRGWNVSLLSDYWLRKASWLVFDKWAAAFPLGTLHKSINCSEAYTACPFNTIHVGYLLAQQCHTALVLGEVMLYVGCHSCQTWVWGPAPDRQCSAVDRTAELAGQDFTIRPLFSPTLFLLNIIKHLTATKDILCSIWRDGWYRDEIGHDRRSCKFRSAM